MPRQVDTGHAFEFAFARELSTWVLQHDADAELVENEACLRSRRSYESFPESERAKYDKAAQLQFPTLSRLEPGLLHAKDASDKLFICLAGDAMGIAGDVRDVIMYRKDACGNRTWEIGVSAKNNNDATKHSRLSEDIRFGEKWMGMDTSSEYIVSVREVFDWVGQKCAMGCATWASLGVEKETRVYVPLLEAFITEMKRLFECDHTMAAQRLIMYLIGRKPFYKVIKNDRDNTSILKVFNFVPGLGKTYNGFSPGCRPQSIPLPTRCVEMDFVDGGQRNTVSIIMDKGWQIDFRIHSASTRIEKSLKFDVRLEGNPPALFTQHMF